MRALAIRVLDRLLDRALEIRALEVQALEVRALETQVLETQVLATQAQARHVPWLRFRRFGGAASTSWADRNGISPT